MPTYEYACRACGHVFDIVQKMSDEPLTICPECGGELRKVFAPPAISFKGSGFYATDHGKGKKPAASSDGKEGGSAKPKKESDGGTKAKDAATPASSGEKSPPAKKDGTGS